MEWRELSEEYFKCMMKIGPRQYHKKEKKMTSGEMFVLIYLMKNGNSPPSEFSEESETSTAHIAKVLRRLEEKGEIIRRPDPCDARRKIVSITEAGLMRTRKHKEDILFEIEVLMKKLGKKDAEEFIRIFKKIIEIHEDRFNC